MFKNEKVLAIIPARAGSKRLPKKNILNLSGQPLITWTIEAAIKSQAIDRIVVSTEDEKIANISMKYGAEVPFLRPKKLASDETNSMDVVIHTLNKLEEKNEHYKYVILLQPTSPLRTNQHIDNAFEFMNDKKAKSVTSVCLAEHHPLWSNTLPEDKSMESFVDRDFRNKRSQDLAKYYRLNGAIYICETKLLQTEKNFIASSDCYAFIMSQDESVDIDNIKDFKLAELLLG